MINKSICLQTYQKILVSVFLSVNFSLIAGKSEKETEVIYCSTICVGEFQEVEFGGRGSFEVTIDHQNTHNCMVCADNKWLSSIKMMIEKNRLSIIAPKDMPQYKPIQCTIKTNLMKWILAKDAADVQIKTKIKNIHELELSAFGTAKIFVDVDVPSLKAIAVDSSQIETVGKAEHQKINLEFKARYNGQNCQAKTIDVEASQNSIYQGFITKDDDERNVAVVTLQDRAQGLIKGNIYQLIYSCPCKHSLEVIGLVTHLQRNIKIDSKHELLYRYSEDLEIAFESEKFIKTLQKKQNKKYLRL